MGTNCLNGLSSPRHLYLGLNLTPVTYAPSACHVDFWMKGLSRANESQCLDFSCSWEQLHEGKEPAQKMKGMASWEAGAGGGGEEHNQETLPSALQLIRVSVFQDKSWRADLAFLEKDL